MAGCEWVPSTYPNTDVSLAGGGPYVQLLAEILHYINDGNYEKAGDAWSFGIGRGTSADQANQDEAVFRKMRRLVYGHVARTVAIQRTSLANPPALDTLADEFKKLMDELTPETREA